jgi:FtsH-binding integral membrane protein
MNLPDEELQSNLEKGQPADDSIDSRAYQKIFDTLKKEPYTLPYSFADNVLYRMESKKNLSKDYFWFGIGLLAFAVAAVIAAVLANFRLDLGAFKFIRGYRGLFLFAVAFIALLHYIDKRFLPKNTIDSR